MKKVVLIAAGIGLSFVAVAQKSQIRSANNYIGEKNYDKAQKAIEAAINDPDTKDDPYAWYTRGNVFLAMQQEKGNEEKEYYREAGKSYKKAATLDPGYKKDELNAKLFGVAIFNFNDGLKAFEKTDYPRAFASFEEVFDIYNINEGKRFSGKDWVKFDTIAQQSRLYQGYSAYYNKQYDQAVSLLEAAKENPIAKNANIYLMLADIYDERKNEDQLKAVLAEGKTAFPQEKAIVNRELNYYIKTNQADQLVAKIEDALQKDPENAALIFTLAMSYDNMANPKEGGKDLPKPANYAELFSKAETAYNQAIKAEDKPEYNYQIGALYYNRAVLLNEEMNAITGSSSAEMKKYDGLKAERDEWFKKSLPFMEKVVTSLEPKASSLNGQDLETYQNAIMAAREIYAKQNRLQEATEYKKKFEALK